MMKTFAILGILVLTSCATGGPGSVRRLSDKDVEPLRAGMTIEQVRELIGRPWQLVLNPLDKRREIHRYVMTRVPTGEEYKYSEDRHSFTLTQYRVLELVYLDGKLTDSIGVGDGK